jgi:hypothetical protein
MADTSTKLFVNFRVKLDEILEEKYQEGVGGRGYIMLLLTVYRVDGIT